MKLTGKNGQLRIYDGTKVLHSTGNTDMVKFDGVTTYTNITEDVNADDAAFASGFLGDNNDAVLIGSSVKFSQIYFLKGAGSNYANSSGAVKIYYYNGVNFTAELIAAIDGTSDGTDCFTQDGVIGFTPPVDWTMGGLSALDADKYYIKIMLTSSPSTAPDADVLCACDGQFFEVAFAGMDFSAPLGRPKTEETLVLNRGNSDSYAHYIEGSDDKIFEPIGLSFSCLLDDTVNRVSLFAALACGNPGSSDWSATGVTTKGLTKNDDTNYNPGFIDTNKKAVNLQILFNGNSSNVGYAYCEVFYPTEGITIAEAEDGVTISTTGGCYGKIDKITQFGNKY